MTLIGGQTPGSERCGVAAKVSAAPPDKTAILCTSTPQNFSLFSSFTLLLPEFLLLPVTLAADRQSGGHGVVAPRLT